MAIQVSYFTDPACPWSWANEPTIRRLMVEFGADLSWTYVMGGLARDFATEHGDQGGRVEGFAGVYPGLVAGWLEASDRSGMPLDPRLWLEDPPSSTYPACMAVKAAAEQASDGGYRYLRALREGILCFRRKLDTTEALVEAARASQLDVARFRLDLASNATVEAFGVDLEAARSIPDTPRAGRERLPALAFGGGESRQWVFGDGDFEACRAAAEAAGAARSGDPPLTLEAALGRFGRMATVEVQAVCGMAAVPAQAELWRLAAGWRLRPVPVLTGHLWELA